MNIHHLELFYYVARHGGISEAVRHMPYGIQQPAISGQVVLLEDYLGTALFHRRPFALTAAGAELYASIKPFFEDVQSMADRIRGGVSQHLRIAASEIVLRDYLPELLHLTRRHFPRLKVTLREGYFPQVLDWFATQEIDVSVGLLSGKPPPGIQAEPLFKLPLVLMVPKNSPLKSAEQLWARDRIEETLINVPSNEPIRRAFQEGLAKRKVDWHNGIEVSTVELVQTYVRNGYGIGVTVGIPKAKFDPKVRLLPLPDFPVPVFGVLWQGRPTPVVNTFLQMVRQAVASIMEGEDPSLLLIPKLADTKQTAV
jgi:DNA-binding transcriptional LysR family regulator